MAWKSNPSIKLQLIFCLPSAFLSAMVGVRKKVNPNLFIVSIMQKKSEEKTGIGSSSNEVIGLVELQGGTTRQVGIFQDRIKTVVTKSW